MTSQLGLKLLVSSLVLLFALLTLTEATSSSLNRVLRRREVVEDDMTVPSTKAKEFLAKLRRPKRNIWDRSRPDVQQWIQQFMYMGYDEARLEQDLAYWLDHARSSDQGRQHHYDENAAIAPRHSSSYRHGANVNYDYY